MTKQIVFDSVDNFLKKSGWHYTSRDNSIFEMRFNVKCKMSNCRVVILPNDDGFSVLSISSMNAGEAERPEVMKYLTKANYGLRDGNFEMDLNDGEVRYKSFHYCGNYDGEVPEKVIDHAMDIVIWGMTRYGDGLLKLIMGFSDADTEIKAVEG